MSAYIDNTAEIIGNILVGRAKVLEVSPTYPQQSKLQCGGYMPNIQKAIANVAEVVPQIREKPLVKLDVENLEPMTKAFVSTIDSWMKVYKKAKNPSQTFYEDLLKGVMTTVFELRKKYPVIDGAVGEGMETVNKIFNPLYKPVMDGVVKEFKRDPWKNITEFTTELLDEMARNRKAGISVPITNAAKAAGVKLALNRFIENLFGGV